MGGFTLTCDLCGCDGYIETTDLINGYTQVDIFCINPECEQSAEKSN